LTSTYTSSSQSQHLQIGSFTQKDSYEEAHLSKYDSELQEFNTSDPISGKFNISQQLLQITGVNKARAMPQNQDVIGTICEDGSVFIFDKTKHTSNETEFKYEIKCQGHGQEGFGLSWNYNNEGIFATGALDGSVKVWDLKKSAQGEALSSVHEKKVDQPINDVEWCSWHDSVFISGDEGNSVKLWDLRQAFATSHCGSNHNNGGVNSVSWNKQHKYCVASGDGEGNLLIWDIRTFNEPLNTTRGHNGPVSSVEWNPHMGNIIASAGADDGIVKLWDCAQEDSLRFTHQGHLLGVNDIAWNPHEPWMMASVSNDNTLHIWQPSVHAMA
jgi:histone-binding protein RBBP4